MERDHSQHFRSGDSTPAAMSPLTCALCDAALPLGQLGFVGRCPRCKAPYRISRSNAQLVAIVRVSARERPPTPRRVLIAWSLYWISLGAAAQVMWVGQADYTNFQITLYYLLLGWGLTFQRFLAPRAKSVLGFVESQRRPVFYALACGCIAIFLGHSQGDSCGLARWPDYVLHPEWAGLFRRFNVAVLPHFSRCRVFPVVIVASVIGWFIGVRAGLRLDQALRYRETDTDSAAPNNAASPRRRERWLLPSGVLVAVVTIRLIGGHAATWPLLMLALLVVVVLSLVRFPETDDNPLVIARARVLTAAWTATVALVPIVVFGSLSFHRETRPIARLISLYPGATNVVSGPSRETATPLVAALHGIGKGSQTMFALLQSDSSQAYAMTTDDPWQYVLRFYSVPSHRLGLELVEDDHIALLLRGNGCDVVVGALRGGYEQRVHIFYFIRRQQARSADSDSTADERRE